MAKKDKKDKNVKKIDNKTEYNLKNSLDKINNTYSSYSTKISDQNSNHEFYSLSNEISSSTPSFHSLNEKFNDKYEVLNKEVSSQVLNLNNQINGLNLNFQEKNEILKKELEDKFSNFVELKYFYGAISVLLVISGIIFALSYQDIHQNSKKIPDLEKRIDKLDENIKGIENKKKPA